MRLLASLFVLLFAISAGAAERRRTLDDAAQDYVHLVLEIGAHEKGFVDAYFGPPEWRIEAEGSSPQHLRTESRGGPHPIDLRGNGYERAAANGAPTQRPAQGKRCERSVSPRHNRGRTLPLPR
jgi:hypothetical protein